MKVLALDSSLQALSVTIAIDSKILACHSHNFSKMDNTKTQKSSLYPRLIIDALNESGLTLEDLNLIATTTGPGSFTGVRTSLTIARTIACELNLKIFCANNFEIIRFEQNIPSNTTLVLEAGKNCFWVSQDENYENFQTNFFSTNLDEEYVSKYLKYFETENLSLLLIKYLQKKLEQNKEIDTLKNYEETIPYYLREPNIGNKK